MNFHFEDIPIRILRNGYCNIAAFASGETRSFVSVISCLAGIPLLALLLRSSPAVDALLLGNIRFAAEELRPLVRTRSDDATRAFFPNMKVGDDADDAEKPELGGLLEVVMSQDEKGEKGKSNRANGDEGAAK